MSLAARVLGILRSPKRTFEAVAASPRWAAVMFLVFILMALSNASLFETEVGRLALTDQWERTAIAFGQEVDDDMYATLQDASRNGAAYAAVSALARGPVLAVVVAAVLFAVLGKAQGNRPTFRQVLAVTAHAGVILALRQMIAAPVSYARETLASPTSLNLFVSILDEASPVARFLGAIDFFVLWWIVVLAVGMSVISHRRARTLTLTFSGAYVVLALVLAIVMSVAGGPT